MKKLILAFGMMGLLALAGCFEVTQELTINEDGSGIISGTTDMSAGMSMMLQFAGEKAKEEKVEMDSVIFLRSMLDTSTQFTAEEKRLLMGASYGVVASTENEKFLLSMNFPFRKMEDIRALEEAMKKLKTLGAMNATMSKSVNEAMGKEMPDEETTEGREESMPGESLPGDAIDEYFDMTITNGLISRSINKQKYAGLNADSSLAKLKEMEQFGAPMKMNFVINLPRPAKKVEGKNVKLSEDKRKLTISNDLNDLYNHSERYEFRVEY